MTPIDLTQFSTRARHCLMAEKLYYREQVASMSDEELRRIPNLGRHSVAEIRSVIPYMTSIDYMRGVLKELQEKVLLLEALLDDHSRSV